LEPSVKTFVADVLVEIVSCVFAHAFSENLVFDEISGSYSLVDAPFIVLELITFYETMWVGSRVLI
jgi:hypothetical protein